MKTDRRGRLILFPASLSPGTEQSILTPQVEEWLPDVQFFLAEDIKTARRSISAMQLGIDISGLRFQELHKKTPDDMIPSLLQPCMEGNDVGLFSEAGMPCIADPGARAVKWAHQHHIKVVPLVGPSSIIMALIASGFNGQQFTFHGYLPIDREARKKSLLTLKDKVIKTGYTQIFMETPYRNDKLLKIILDTLFRKGGNDISLCIAVNITAPDECIMTKHIGEWKQQTPELGKRPAIFLFGI